MMRNIEQLASKFRKAIDVALEAGEFDNDSIYCRFPRACCGDTSTIYRNKKLKSCFMIEYIDSIV